MALIEVTSREFREKLKDFFDKADKGEKVIIKRKDRTYAIIPVDENDLNFSPLMEEKISEFKGIKSEKKPIIKT